MDQMLTGVFAYDPSQITLLLGGWEPYGYSEGTKIVINKENDVITPYTGTDGDTSLALNRNKRGTMTLSLQRTSSANAYLQTFVSQMYRTRFVAFPVYLKDPRGNSYTTLGWIQGQPDDTMSDSIESNDWVLGLQDVSQFSGSNTGAAFSVLNAISPAVL